MDKSPIPEWMAHLSNSWWFGLLAFYGFLARDEFSGGWQWWVWMNVVLAAAISVMYLMLGALSGALAYSRSLCREARS